MPYPIRMCDSGFVIVDSKSASDEQKCVAEKFVDKDNNEAHYMCDTFSPFTLTFVARGAAESYLKDMKNGFIPVSDYIKILLADNRLVVKHFVTSFTVAMED